MACKCISNLPSSEPPSSCLSSLHLGFHVHLPMHSLTASQCISKLDRTRPPSASPSSLELGLQVDLHTSMGTPSKYIVKERRCVYGDTELLEVECATWSIYSGYPGVDRQHLIFISFYHTTKIHTVPIPTFGLNCSFREFVDSLNCVDSPCRVVSYLHTLFLHSSSLR